ncbi:protein GOLM2-like [Brienomyrus brachyistius]|uniref:protein GOLM2-like n=1 Tax=Brienomyrus brachyistius TaxID=42636 RepID=UPI0020B180CA|nr:protein GOLM2-like [Brienomyrus brachyistius]
MMGFGANRRGGRLPSFVMIALVILVLFISFNYWDVSRQRGRLLDELAEAQAQVKRTDAARSRLEKRNSELMVQVDGHRKEVDQKEGERNTLRNSLQAVEVQFKRCNDEKMKIQSDSFSQVSEIQRLKEQLKELKQEYMKQEGLLQELKKNRTSMDKKLEFESLQCKQKINQLNGEHLEKQRILEEEVFQLRKNRAMETAHKTDRDVPRLTVHHPDVPRLTVHHPDVTDTKELGKLAAGADVPGLRDGDLEKVKEAAFALRKPAITRKQVQHAVDGPAKAQDHAGPLGSEVLPLKLDTKVERLAAGAGDGVRDVPQDQGAMEGGHADGRAGQQGQLPVPDRVKVAAVDEKREGLQVAPNPAQVLAKPMENEPAWNPHPAQIQNEGQHVAEGRRHQAVDML